MEVFLRRAERPFKERIGEEKTSSAFNAIKKATNEIPAKFRRVIGSEIPKFLFTFSQDIGGLSPELIEGILSYVLIFAESLKDLSNKDRTQVNQLLMKRSNSEVRTLSDLLKLFVESAKVGKTMKNQGSFENILSLLFGDEADVSQHSDVELFIKRAEKNFSSKIGDKKTYKFSEGILNTLTEVDDNIKEHLSSEIPKFVFKFSQNLNKLSVETIERKLSDILLFNKALSNLNGKTKDQLNQQIIKRSKNKLFTIMDLFKAFLEAEKENNQIKQCDNLEDILVYLLGYEEKRIQFTDVEAFLKRAEKKYALIVGQDMIQMLMEELLDAIENIPELHREYLGSDLAKFLFTYSETASYHEPEKVELVFNGAILFANSLIELGDLNKAEINQFIIKRSKSKVRSLFDLYKAFLVKIEIRMPLSPDPNFDEILIHTLGRYDGPKEIERGGLIHDLLADFHEEIPLAKEHANWGKALSEIIPRFLDILPNPEGDRILDFLWENKFPEDQIQEKYREKLAGIPREKEKTFTFRLFNLLTNQILLDETKDKALTGALAFKILGTLFIEIYGGRNAQIRGIRLNQLLKDRKIANPEKKQNLDEHINHILEEDLKSIQQRTMTINTIVPILSKKGFFIKTYDIVTKDFPELIVKIISYREEERLKDIGTEYKKSGFTGELIPLVNGFLQKLDYAHRFYKKYFEEMYSISFDAQRNMLSLREFFKFLVELRENMDTIEFFEYKVANTEHAIYILILKFLYIPLIDVFDTTRIILDQQEYQKKIIKLDKYLSNQKLEQLKLEIIETEKKIKEYEEFKDFDASQKITNYTKFLNRDKNEIKFYDIMFKLLNDSAKISEKLKSRLEFSMELLKFSKSLKKIHSSLPAALSENLGIFGDFSQKIDEIVEKLKEKSSSGILSPFEFREKNDAAEKSKKFLLELISNEDFISHVENLIKMPEGTIIEA
ncbi:hypothetical protein LCGC14_0545460 [marine sediment metagenome]|uniref:Uncharacterized protein n=1 Tax=marine sediment metagenome TaxID=412755 RepID=A0A0F9UZQ4_9ZZZZ|nr:MAG: hypothetical protein Lokiarch_46900 [Candidatus Lokiarchaeum sp. GC14_75]HEA70856.1 hypothetical protein [archaeon]